MIVSIKWIDPKVALPESDQDVLIHLPPSSYGKDVWIGFYDYGDQCWRQADALTVDEVWHWAYLPEPPETK